MLLHVVVPLCITIVSAATVKQIVAQSGKPMKQSLPWYHTTQEVHEAMVASSKSCVGAQVEVKSRPFADAKGNANQIDVLHIRPLGTTPETKALFVFGEHARELISVESAVGLVNTVCGQGSNSEVARSVLKSVELILVPNANPLARTKVESGMYCKRTNEDGVDLNRNWGDKHQDVKFNQMMKGDETDPGPRGFSEPETKVLRDLIDEERPDIYLSVHSGAHMLGIPYGYSSKAKLDNANDMLEVLRPISEKHCQHDACPYGNLADLAGYENNGCDIDYVREQFQTPYVFTWEIYRGSGPPESFAQLSGSRALQRLRRSQKFQTRLPEAQQDPDVCIRHFNPLTEKATKSVIENWTGAYLDLCRLVAEKQATKRRKQDKLGAIALGSWLSR
jgi:hypothetical protein